MRKPLRIAFVSFALLLFASAFVFWFRYRECIRDICGVHFEPAYNALFHPTGHRWKYLHVPRSDECLSLDSQLVTFDARGRLLIVQSTGLFDTELFPYDRYGPNHVEIFRTMRLAVFVAAIRSGGTLCELASDRFETVGEDRATLAGFDTLKTIAAGDPQNPGVLSHLYYHPAAPATIYRAETESAGRNDLVHGLSRSVDNGRSWVKLTPEVYGRGRAMSVELNAFHPKNAGGLFVICRLPDDPNRYFAVSADDGNTLEVIGAADDFANFAIAPSRPGTCYRVRKREFFDRTDEGPALGWRPVDGGVVLSPVQVVGQLRSVWVRHIAVHPEDPSLLLVTTTKGVLRSADGGESWSTANLWVPNYESVSRAAFDPIHPEFAYAATRYGLRISRDRGKTWEPFDLAGCVGEEAFRTLTPLGR